jgi:CheY-like chemotaxis protein
MIQIKRILLVEDNEKDVELVLAALGDHNLANEVIVVRDGAEALDFLFRRGEFAERQPGQPVVVLLDLKMPKVDGLEVLKQVKNDPELKRIPVVMMTSSREEQDLVKSYALGANAYVVKPVDFQQFVDSIKQIGFFWAVINEPPPGCAATPGAAAIGKHSIGATGP